MSEATWSPAGLQAAATGHEAPVRTCASAQVQFRPNVVGQVVEVPLVLPKEPLRRLHLPSTVGPTPVEACVAEVRKHPIRRLLSSRVVRAAGARGTGHGRCPVPALAGFDALPKGATFVLWFLGTTGHVAS